ncbi:MAG: translation initiation factor eIF-2B [Candidatus Pacearchaeota archaeon]
MDSFSKVCKDISSIKIQGATNVAKAGLNAYCLKPTKSTIKKLISLRPTEPALRNALAFAEKSSVENALNHFANAQEFINYYALKIISKNSRIMTHCHSKTLELALVSAHKSGKIFSVLNLETRPLMQGHITARNLLKKGIDVTMSVDSAMHLEIKQCDIVILGADAVTKKGVLNKIGSGAIAELAHQHKKPVYIITDSWKFSNNSVPIEERSNKEVWKNHPKKIKIINPSFELIKPKFITAIISELGILKYDIFLKEAKNSISRS